MCQCAEETNQQWADDRLAEAPTDVCRLQRVFSTGLPLFATEAANQQRADDLLAEAPTDARHIQRVLSTVLPCFAAEAANRQWADDWLSEARAAIDLPALAPSDAVLMRDTSMQARPHAQLTVETPVRSVSSEEIGLLKRGCPPCAARQS